MACSGTNASINHEESTMPFFRLTFFIETGSDGDTEIEVEKLVEARDADHALDMARKLREEIPEITPDKITAWHIEETDPSQSCGGRQ
jgi:hypothetical protein